MNELNKMFTNKELGLCPFCSKPVNKEDFRDPLSRREFLISGLCQECQDKVFGVRSYDN